MPTTSPFYSVNELRKPANKRVHHNILNLPDTKKAERLCIKAVEERTQDQIKVLYGLETKEKEEQSKAEAQHTLREDAKQKLAALAELEKRSVSNLIEVMADESWEELAERQGVDYAKTVAEIVGLKALNADKEADCKVFRREILERVLKFKKR